MELGIFQTLVRRWCVRAFGQQVADNHRERNHRFLEEALELGQSLGCTAEDAHVLVEYVYGRPAGRPGQEVGGVMVTLAALCGAHPDLSMDAEAKQELARINRPEVLDKIRRKQAAKQRDIPLSPLPGGANHMQRLSTGAVADERLLRAYRAEIAAGTHTHDCGEWWLDGKCQLCDRPQPPENRVVREGDGPTDRDTQLLQQLDAVGTTGGKATVSHARRAPSRPGDTYHQHQSGCRCNGCTVS